MDEHIAAEALQRARHDLALLRNLRHVDEGGKPFAVDTDLTVRWIDRALRDAPELGVLHAGAEPPE